MTEITNTTQLSTFEMIKGILKTNSSLIKIRDSQYHKFSPNLKSTGFTGFPFIIITSPRTNNLSTFQGNTMNHKSFTVNITLVLEYKARDNYDILAGGIVSSIDAAQSTFTSNGYSLVNINVDTDPIPDVFDEKQVIVGSFELVLEGTVVI